MRRPAALPLNLQRLPFVGKVPESMMREQSSPSSPEINLTQAYTLGQGDVSDPEVSYDGTKILFAMRCSAQSSPSCYNYQNQGIYDFTWNVWEYDLRTRLMRRVTENSQVSRQGDDVDPAYLPDGRIVFSSNRQATSCNPLTSGAQQPPAIQCAAAGSAPGRKGAIYSIYNRALRENPSLQGKVVLKLAISASGQVLDCKIVSSELRSPELERKLAARIRQFDFGARNVDTMVVTYPIDFLPS